MATTKVGANLDLLNTNKVINSAAPTAAADLATKGYVDGTTTFTFTQSTPLLVWNVVHGLGRFPAVSVVDSAGDIVLGDVVYIDSTRLTVTFGAPFSGAVYLT